MSIFYGYPVYYIIYEKKYGVPELIFYQASPRIHSDKKKIT